MALEQPELWATTTQGSHGNFEPREVQVCTFATNAGAIGVRTLAVGTAVAHNGANWIYLDGDNNNGTEVLRGFVYPDPIVLSTADEVQGQVMVAGRADYNALVAAHDDAGVGYSAAELATSIQAFGNARGLFVKNLIDVR